MNGKAQKLRRPLGMTVRKSKNRSAACLEFLGKGNGRLNYPANFRTGHSPLFDEAVDNIHQHKSGVPLGQRGQGQLFAALQLIGKPYSGFCGGSGEFFSVDIHNKRLPKILYYYIYIRYGCLYKYYTVF